MTESASASPGAFVATKRYRRYLLGLLLLVMTCNYADRYVIGILLPQIKSDLALTDTQIGFITGAAFTVFYALLGVPIASLADRRSRRKIIAWALALWSLMTCLCGLARSFVQLAVFRVLVGIGEAGCTPPSHSLVSDYFSARERALAMAVLGLGSSLGVFLAFLVGGWITDTYGWRVTLVSFGAPGMLIALVVYGTLRDPPRGHSDGVQAAAKAPAMFPAFRKLWAKKTFRYMVLGGSMYGMVSTALRKLEQNSRSFFAPASRWRRRPSMPWCFWPQTRRRRFSGSSCLPAWASCRGRCCSPPYRAWPMCGPVPWHRPS